MCVLRNAAPTTGACHVISICYFRGSIRGASANLPRDKTLQMQSFFTCGPDEVRQWSIRNGFTAPEAAGTIHTDFQKHFICCETYAFKDWNKAGATFAATAAVRSAGKVRTEGKKYVMKDGDICFFKHNAGK